MDGVSKKMSKRLILGIIGAIVLLIGWWSFHPRASPVDSSSPRTSGRRGAGPGGPVPVVAGKVEQKDMPIYRYASRWVLLLWEVSLFRRS